MTLKIILSDKRILRTLKVNKTWYCQFCSSSKIEIQCINFLGAPNGAKSQSSLDDFEINKNCPFHQWIEEGAPYIREG